MNNRPDRVVRFEPEELGLASVAVLPRTWHPVWVRCGQPLNPLLWQTRAARGLSWHRSGRAFKRGPRQ